jgi:hypothetical protein
MHKPAGTQTASAALLLIASLILFTLVLFLLFWT